MTHKVKAYITVILFVLLIGSAYIIWPIVKDEMTGVNTENRNLVERPVFSWNTISKYPGEFETYVNDHLPFRSKLIEYNSAIDYYVFKSSSSDSVSIGKNGWLFYKGENSTEFYKGRKLYTEEELKQIAENMQSTKEHLEEKGIKFVLYIAPNKERVYWEHLPDHYGMPAENNALKQVLEYLELHTDVNVVCPYNSLIEKKKNDSEAILYHKTDTHWNELGAYIGACDLFESLGIIWNNNVSIEKVDDNPGDMANMLNLGNLIDPGNTCKVYGYMQEDTQCIENSFFGNFRYISPSQDTGKLLMCRDSFCTAMAPVIGSAFSESLMVHRQSFTNDIIDQEQPDYFVYETVERSLDVLLTYRY